jgi:hypothetical protein
MSSFELVRWPLQQSMIIPIGFKPVYYETTLPFLVEFTASILFFDKSHLLKSFVSQ